MSHLPSRIAQKCFAWSYARVRSAYSVVMGDDQQERERQLKEAEEIRRHEREIAEREKKPSGTGSTGPKAENEK